MRKKQNKQQAMPVMHEYSILEFDQPNKGLRELENQAVRIFIDADADEWIEVRPSRDGINITASGPVRIYPHVANAVDINLVPRPGGG